jgi:uncharacterized ubiquitin-like protein YukD
MNESRDFDEWSPQGPVEELSDDSCWELLRRESFGRLAVSSDNHPQIFPVDYYADGDEILFRTSDGTKLKDLIANDVVVFEVDLRSRSESWSVMVHGKARVLSADDEISAADRAPLPSWIPVAPYVYVKVVPTSVHGRRFVHSLFPLRVRATQ